VQLSSVLANDELPDEEDGDEEDVYAYRAGVACKGADMGGVTVCREVAG